MNPTRINILGEDYFLYSQRGADSEKQSVSKADANKVLLLPSLAYDFSVKSYGKDGKEEKHNPAAALAAAAHLTLVRGLPIKEFSFELADGNIEVFCTGDGFFEIEIPKCKVLFTGAAEIFGCEVHYTDVFAFGVHRVVATENISNADASTLAALINVGRYLPDALLFSSLSDGELEILPYTDFNPTPPPRLLLYTAAYLANRKSHGEFFAKDGSLSLRRDYSSVHLRVKCEIK